MLIFLSPLGVSESPLVMPDPGWSQVPRDGSDFNLLRERGCTSLSINTCGLDWTHLKSLAVNEREREVTRLYRPVIICWERPGEGRCEEPEPRQLPQAGNRVLNHSRLLRADPDYLFNPSQGWKNRLRRQQISLFTWSKYIKASFLLQTLAECSLWDLCI